VRAVIRRGNPESYCSKEENRKNLRRSQDARSQADVYFHAMKIKLDDLPHPAIHALLPEHL
jgi:hypothetical protein